MIVRAHLVSALLACALLAACGTAIAGQPASTVHKSLHLAHAIPSGTTIKVENLVGHVTVQPGASGFDVTGTVVAGGKDRAAAEALAGSIRLSVRRMGDTAVVHVVYPVDRISDYRYVAGPEMSQRGTSRSEVRYQGQRVSIYRGYDTGVPLHVDLVVSVPADARAGIHNKVGPMDANHVHATLALDSDSGDIHAADTSGKLAIHSDSGDVEATGTHGTLTIDSDSGDVHVSSTQGNATVNADSGDVVVTDLRGSALRINADSGDVSVSGANASLQLNADSGDIRLRDLGTVPHLGANADSGDIDVRGDMQGIGSFTLATDNGDVRLSTSRPPQVHLDIRGSDVHVQWPSVHDAHRDDDRFTGDVGKATGTGQIQTDDGAVVLTQ